MGNLLSDVTLELGNPVFNSREKKSIDVCLLNHGGIRTIISKGDITARTAFEVMPFENSLVIVGLKGTDITTIASYIIKEKKPHPLAGMTFTIGKDNLPKDILVQGKPVDPNKIYYVGTSDYLSNGGDNMSFFKNGVERYDLNYKLRNILIDYFKKVETIPLINDVRISVE
jgi:2',3'-cyclic-nucleotide 2'-phosphodiesterase (5'-nucleotidase family)